MLILILCHLVVEDEGVEFLSFIIINGVFGITKCLVALVSTIALCEYGGYRTGCCKIS